MADSTRLHAILELVEESLDEPRIDGAELAGRAYLSRYHFDRLVQAASASRPASSAAGGAWTTTWPPANTGPR